MLQLWLRSTLKKALGSCRICPSWQPSLPQLRREVPSAQIGAGWAQEHFRVLTEVPKSRGVDPAFSDAVSGTSSAMEERAQLQGCAGLLVFIQDPQLRSSTKEGPASELLYDMQAALCGARLTVVQDSLLSHKIRSSPGDIGSTCIGTGQAALRPSSKHLLLVLLSAALPGQR